MVAMTGYLAGFITRKVQWATWQFSVVKLAAVSLGIIAGVYFAGFWRPLLLPLWVVFVVTSVWASAMWCSAWMKKGRR